MPANKFHYIWMGVLPTGEHAEHFSSGPNGLAQQIRDYQQRLRRHGVAGVDPQEIIMWVPQALIRGIQEAHLLDPDIELRAVESIYRDAEPGSDAGLSPRASTGSSVSLSEEFDSDGKESPDVLSPISRKQKENLAVTVELLGEHRAYSAQKDVLSAAILETQGGYYFDTTLAVKSVERLIDFPPKDIWFPRLSDDVDDGNFLYNGDILYSVDVWALYNPAPGTRTFGSMLDSYIERCQFYFPEKFPDVVFDISRTLLEDGDPRSGYFGEPSYGAGREILSGSSRDDFIGQTVIASFFDGLAATKGPLKDLDILYELSSLATRHRGAMRVEDYDIEKRHRGLWRRQAPSAPSAPVAAAAPAVRVDDIPHKNRRHAFQVQGADIAGIDEKYRGLRGDLLKHRILCDFKAELAAIPDRAELDDFVQTFKRSPAYAALARPQGLLTKFSPLQTDSKKMVDELIREKEASFEGPSPSA